MGDGWIPWHTLREHPEIDLVWDYLPDSVRGLYRPRVDGSAIIVIDATLDQAQRNATLGHELIHHERGIVGDERLDERGVNDELARRLVPFDELHAMWRIAVLNDLTVEVWQVAEKFGVPDELAERAMRLFLAQRAA